MLPSPRMQLASVLHATARAWGRCATVFLVRVWRVLAMQPCRRGPAKSATQWQDAASHSSQEARTTRLLGRNASWGVGSFYC